MTVAAMEVAPLDRAVQASSRIEIREATKADNAALLALTRATPMGGTITLRIDRDPDFFALLRARGKAVVYVATHEDMVVGCLSAAIHDSYIMGAIEKIAHVGDLKVHPSFRRGRVSARLIAALRVHLQREHVDICCSLVADGNDAMTRMVEGKHRLAREVPMGRFLVDALLPLPFVRKPRRYAIEQANKQDLPHIAAMLDRVNSGRNFAPVITAEHLENYLEPAPSNSFRKMFVAREAGRVIATLTIEDTRHLRQNVLVGLPKSLSLALAILRVVTLPIPRFTLPSLGGELSILYVRFMGCVEGREDALRPLIARARSEAYWHRFTFLSIGLHERDPIRTILSGTLRFTFTSRSMATGAIDEERVKQLVDRIPYEDFALV